MNESGAPLWLQIAIASIPLLVALIGGAFALNTINNRVERLKNLVEIRKGIPKVLNQDHAVERVMIQELNAIEKSTTPWRAQYRGQYILASLVFYIAAFLYYFNGHLFKLSNIANGIANVAMLASSLYFVVGYWVWRNRLKEMKDQQEARFKLLDSLAALPERRDTGSATE